MKRRRFQVPTKVAPLFPVLRPLTRALTLHGFSPESRPTAQKCWNEEIEEILSRRLAATALSFATHHQISLPEEIRSRLMSNSFSWAERSLTVIAQTASSLEMLSDNNIPFVITKGPGIAVHYPNRSHRPFNDLDVLIEPTYFSTAVSLLCSANLVESQRNVQPWTSFNRWCREAINLEDGRGGSIDVHHHIPPWFWAKNLTAQLLASEVQSVELNGVQLPCASPRHNLLVSALHVVSDHNRPGQTVMAWRDVLTMAATCPAKEAVDAAQRTGLAGWLRWIIGELPEDARPADLYYELCGTQESIAGSLRLQQMLPPKLGSRHLLGQTLRLPLPGAALFVAGMCIPSPNFLQQKFQPRGQYIQWWRHLAMNLQDARSSNPA